MNAIDITTTDLASLGAVELRKLGGQLGVKGASKGKKAELLEAIGEIQVAQRKAKEDAKPTPKVAKKSLTEDEWCMEENGHSDQDHEAIAAGRGEELGWKPEYIAEVQKVMEVCAICHPELYRARKAQGQTGRYSVSRAGMQVNVSRRMTAQEKAELVAKKLKTSKITAGEGFVTLTGKTAMGSDVELIWNDRGNFQHRASRVAGKKVLNVAAALRAIG